jgi:hypothetical protein
MTKRANRICRCGHEEFDHVGGNCRVCGGPCKFRARGRQKSAVAGSDRQRLATQQLHADIAEAVNRFLKNIGDGRQQLPMLKPSRKKTSFDSVDEIRAALPTLTKAAAPPSERSPAKVESLDLGKGERAVLTVAAQFFSGGATKRQVQQITGYTRRTCDQYVSNLRVVGFVVDHDGKIQATKMGISWLGDDYKPLPVGDALYRFWLHELGQGERRVLELLHDEWPDALLKGSINAALKYTRRTCDQYLSNLRVRRLIEDVGRGAVRAAEILFDD